MDWHTGNETTNFDQSGTYTVELIVPQTVKWLRERAETPETPWFLYLPFHLIHGPNQVPDAYMALYPTLKPNQTAASQGMCGVCECADPPRPSPPGGNANIAATMPSNRREGWPRLNNSDDTSGPESKADSSQGTDVTWLQCHTVLAMAAALYVPRRRAHAGGALLRSAANVTSPAVPASGKVRALALSMSSKN